MKKIGLIAGNRNFPLLFSQQAKLKDPSLEIIAVAVKGETNPRLAKFVDRIYWINIGRLNSLLDVFLKEKIDTAIFAGQISPYRIFKDRGSWDNLMHQVVNRTPDFRPHSIFTEIITELGKHGLNFLSSITYLEDYLAKQGLNNKVIVTEALKKNIDYALGLTRKIVDLDIGQTVVFKDKAIVAVEALEGTDNTIKRARRICGNQFMVIKLARRNQDLRFDVPVVGLGTIKILAKCKACALVLEKDKTLILDKEKVIALSNKENIPIVGV